MISQGFPKAEFDFCSLPHGQKELTFIQTNIWLDMDRHSHDIDIIDSYLKQLHYRWRALSSTLNILYNLITGQPAMHNGVRSYGFLPRP